MTSSDAAGGAGFEATSTERFSSVPVETNAAWSSRRRRLTQTGRHVLRIGESSSTTDPHARTFAHRDARRSEDLCSLSPKQLADTHHSPPARSEPIHTWKASNLQLVYLVYLVYSVCGAEGERSATSGTGGTGETEEVVSEF